MMLNSIMTLKSGLWSLKVIENVSSEMQHPAYEKKKNIENGTIWMLGP